MFSPRSRSNPAPCRNLLSPPVCRGPPRIDWRLRLNSMVSCAATTMAGSCSDSGSCHLVKQPQRHGHSRLPQLSRWRRFETKPGKAFSSLCETAKNESVLLLFSRSMGCERLFRSERAFHSQQVRQHEYLWVVFRNPATGCRVLESARPALRQSRLQFVILQAVSSLL